MSQEDSRIIQYANHGGTWIRCGATRKAMEPGFYDVTNCGDGIWGLSPKAIVSDELIDIPGTVADEIYADIDKFMVTRDEYQLYGLTHKRGYLFYGPPGSGKTSLGIMLARRFVERAGGVVMYCGSHREFYHGVGIMRDVEPGRPSMYLIEEADAIVNNTDCLSILDGELSIQGAVFVAMTNYKEKLPPRISNRPGRFDRVTQVSCPPPEVQLEYLRRVEARGGKNPAAPARIVAALEGLPISLAHLREAFISHVLMGLPLPELRKRFEKMTGKEDDSTDALFKSPSEDPEYDEAREELVSDAKDWNPAYD